MCWRLEATARAGRPAPRGEQARALTSDFAVDGGLVSTGQSLTLTIGGNASGRNGGAHGGGNGGYGDGLNYDYAGGGGGATEVRGTPGPDARLVVAGGGGGAGNGGYAGSPGGVNAGGNGGSTHLTGGGDGAPVGPGGHGGAGQVGGLGGSGSSAAGDAGGNGDPTGPGGNGSDGHYVGINTDLWNSGGGGGGGAGYAGGGGGGAGGDNGFTSGGGGGGAAGLSFSAGTISSSAASDGTPRVVISYAATSVSGLDPTITGLAQVGQTLTAHEGPVNPSDAALSYQWNQNGNPINNATGSTYKLKAAQAGKTITVTITASKPPLTSETETSDPTPYVREKVDGPQVQTDPTTAARGSNVDVIGKGLSPGVTYTIRIGRTSLGTATADQYGEINTSVTVPSNTKTGIQFVTITAPNGKVSSTVLVVK